MHHLPKKIPLVYYHSVGLIVNEWNRNFLTVNYNVFEQHLKYYKKNYSVISLSDYYNIRKGTQPSPNKPLVITIDDGFLDNWIWAFPLLKKYNLQATIFVSPEMVDTRSIVRPTLEDLWNGNVKKEDLKSIGYMSWEEMKLMENSGIISIESHTMSHAKYFVSDKIVDFHHPGVDCLYPVGNIFPDQKPFHILNEKFEKLVPYGTPFFEERSSVVAKKVVINPELNEACVETLKGYDFSNYVFEDLQRKIKPVYDSFSKKDAIILSRETDEEFLLRLNYEISESKRIIGSKLNKQVEFLCWPHGDNSIEAHRIAMVSGYKATTIGKQRSIPATVDRIGSRLGFGPYYGSTTLGFLKLKTKIKEVEGNNSAKLIKKLYQTILGKKK